MHLIDSDGATINNRFTEGDPESLIPATIVSAAIANAWQLEIANLIVLGANTALLTSGTDTYLQLLAAVQKMIKKGGTRNPFSFALANNVASPTNVTGIVFDKTVTKSVRFLVDIHRRTDSTQINEVGELYMIYQPDADTWVAKLTTTNGDAGITFSVTTAGQLQYVSTNLAGASYACTMRLSEQNQIDFDATLLPAP